jgi:hypothetical protein
MYKLNIILTSFLFILALTSCSPYLHPNANDTTASSPLKTLSAEQAEQVDAALSMPYKIDQILSKSVTNPTEIPEKMIKQLIDTEICINDYKKETKPSGDFKETIAVTGTSCPIEIKKLLVKDSFTSGQEQLVYNFKIKTADLSSLFGFSSYEAKSIVQLKEDQNKNYSYFQSGTVTISIYKLERLQVTFSGFGVLRALSKNSSRKHTFDFEMPKYSSEKLIYEAQDVDSVKSYKLLRNDKKLNWEESNLTQFIKFLSLN